MELNEFAVFLNEELDLSDGDSFEVQDEKFTLTALEFLAEAGEYEDAALCFHRQRGMKVNAWEILEETGHLHLLAVIRRSGVMDSVSQTDVQKEVDRLSAFLKFALDGGHTQMDRESAGFDLAFQIYTSKLDLNQCLLTIVTNGVVRKRNFETPDVGSLKVAVDLWDLQRLHRQKISGAERENIEANLDEMGFPKIHCLEKAVEAGGYKTYLTLFPGELLFALYDKWGPRLLERNVRAFLQARGGVNKGIRKTINEEPEMFYAYNNGITATADSVDLEQLGGIESDVVRLKTMRGLQIVNGGQTTASIYHAVKKDKCSVSGLSVQVKLTVPDSSATMDEMVPLISRYANTQNRVNIPDLLSNHPFHRKLEELSRTMWAPPVAGSTEQTRWFYERARGQFMDAKANIPASSASQRKTFNKEHPARQKFTKTDVARFENIWAQRPHIVGLGAQKNFVLFTEELAKKGKDYEPDTHYFEELIAKAIMVKTTDTLVRKQQYGGFPGNVVAYTLSWIFHQVAQQVDLVRIWKNQCLSESFQALIVEMSGKVRNQIVKSAGTRNPGEWCKKEACWSELLEALPAQDSAGVPELEKISPRKTSLTKVAAGGAQIGMNEEELSMIDDTLRQGDGYWWALASWAKSTDQLESWQRGIAASIAKALGYGRKPSIKQAKQGIKISREAERLGFRFDPEE